MQTPWGYEIEDLDYLVDIDTFHTMTGNRFAGDERVELMIASASQSIRDYCGWHVMPQAECKAFVTGDGTLVRLPSMNISEIISIKEEGVDVEDYELSRTGLLRRRSGWSDKWECIEVEYVAGLESDALVTAVVQLVANSLSAPMGVASESAGNVSISYSNPGGGINIANNSAIKMLLAPYRIVGAF